MRCRTPRWSAWLVLASIVGNQVLFAYEPERSYWEQRRQEKAKRFADPTGPLLARGPSLGGSSVLPVVEKISPRADYSRGVSLPAGLNESVRSYFSAVPIANATIRKIHLPKNGNPRGLVFHILDVHRNLDAQTNIAHTVSSLIGLPPSSPIAMVGLEGAFRPYDLTWLRSFPDPGATRMAAEDLLAQDKMSGPMFSLLTASTPIPPVIGIDDEPHYQANLSAYRRSLATKEADHAQVKIRVNKFESDKTAAFNPELKAFDETVQGYHRGTVSLGIYTRALARKGGPPLAKPIALFLETLEKEETLDFQKVEQQRAGLVESLAQKMNPTQTNELVSRSVSYRAGHLSYGDFYRWIGTLCEEVGVPLSQFPAMAEYIRYVLLSKTIDAEDLLAECRRREKILFEHLAKTDHERDLISQSHYMTLVEKLLDFSLTPDEWADYEQVRVRGGEGVNLEPYESFYRQAHARDEAMAENLLGALEKTPAYGTSTPPVSLIVTGGYHGPGLKEKLTQAGMAVVTVVPKIEKIDTTQGSSYLTVFAQEKTPLDKLFEGAKLFVADAPLPKTTAPLQAAGSVLISQTPGDSLTPKALAFLETHFDGVSVVWDQGIATITLSLFGRQFAIRYDPSQPVGKKISLEDSGRTTPVFKKLLILFRSLVLAFLISITSPFAGATEEIQNGTYEQERQTLVQRGFTESQANILVETLEFGYWRIKPEGTQEELKGIIGKTYPISGIDFLLKNKLVLFTLGIVGLILFIPTRVGKKKLPIPIAMSLFVGIVFLTNHFASNLAGHTDPLEGVIYLRPDQIGSGDAASYDIPTHELAHLLLPADINHDTIYALGNLAVIEKMPSRVREEFISAAQGLGKDERRGFSKAVGAYQYVENNNGDFSKGYDLLIRDARSAQHPPLSQRRKGRSTNDQTKQFLKDVPKKALRNRLVIVRVSPTDAGVGNNGGQMASAQKTIKYLVDAGAKVVLIMNSIATGAESGKPYDITSHAEQLGKEMGKNIPVLKGEDSGTKFRLIGMEERRHIGNMQAGEVVCLQDPRLDSRDKSDNPFDKEDLARDLATLGPNALYVFDGVQEADAEDATVAILPKFLPGVKGLSQTEPKNPALSGWDPAVRSVVKGVVDLNKDPTFWTRLLANPLYKGFVFYFDQFDGSYEIYSRENHPGDLADHPDDEISELFRRQYRANVHWGADETQGGIPETSHYFLTHADHKPLVIVFPKTGGDPVVYEGYSEETKKAMETARFVVVHNPDRAKRPGRDSAEQTKKEAEANPGMKILAPLNIFNLFPMEMWLTWTSPDGQIYYKTTNIAGYIPNDPYGGRRAQVDHMTMSHASVTSQGELMSEWAIQDTLQAFFSQEKSDREIIRVTGNGWYYGDFSAGASQNILHNHLVRLVLLIERAGRTIVGSEGGVTVGHLNDNEDARATYFEIGSKDDLPALVKALRITYKKITQKGHSFNFIVAPNGEHGARVFVGDKIAGVPKDQFPNPSAFAEFGLVFIVDNPAYAFNLTEAQVEELKATDNVAEWVIKNWREDSITLRKDLEQKCAKSIDLVSASRQDYKNLAQVVLNELRALKRPQLDSLLSRILSNEVIESKTLAGKIFWTMAKATNDFIVAPILETALFFLLPAMSGSGLALMGGVIIFVTLHFLDDYFEVKGGISSDLSHSIALNKAMRRAVPRLWRSTILYAMPFALFMVPSELIPLLQQFGLGSLISLVKESSLFEIAGTVALLHSGRNFIKTVSVAMMNKFPSLAFRKDTPLIFILSGFPIVAYASSLVVDPSLPFLFLAALPWQAILVVLLVAAGVWGVSLISRAVSRSGGQESDELDAINRILGSGLPHWKVAEYLLITAKETESEVVARAAVLPLLAPWRNLSIELDSTIGIFEDRGWHNLARAISSTQTDPNPNWLSPLAERNAKRIGSALFLRKTGDLAREQDDLVRYLLEVFPNSHRFDVEQLGSPGLNQINNIGLDLKNGNYRESFGQNLVEFFKDLKLDRSVGELPLPTAGQALARLRKFADKKHDAGSDENKVPIQLEVYTMADIETARETILLLQVINAEELTPIRLLLAGADQETVNALKTAAVGVANVVVAESPVATLNNGSWSLETSRLSNQFEGLKESLGIGDEFALEVSLSETISVDKSTLESQTTEKFNEALKQALLRFILNEPRPFHFNTMLKIVLAIKQSA